MREEKKFNFKIECDGMAWGLSFTKTICVEIMVEGNQQSTCLSQRKKEETKKSYQIIIIKKINEKRKEKYRTTYFIMKNSSVLLSVLVIVNPYFHWPIGRQEREKLRNIFFNCPPHILPAPLRCMTLCHCVLQSTYFTANCAFTLSKIKLKCVLI